MLIIKKNEANEILITKLNQGNVIIIPTDTVYGLVTIWKNKNGYKKIFNLKKRDFNKKIAILVDSIKTAKKLAIIPDEIEKMWNSYPAGKLTIILMKNKQWWVNCNFDNDDKIAIRITNSKWLQKIIKFSGPLWATSANISNEPVIKSINENKINVDLIVDGGIINAKSSIVFDSINNIFIRE